MSYASVLARSPVIIYEPGGTPGGLVVTDWMVVKRYIADRQGGCTVAFDDSSQSPALIPATSGITECMGRVRFTSAKANAVTPTLVEIENGATLKNPGVFDGTLVVECGCKSATPSIDFDFVGNNSFVIESGAILTNSLDATNPGIVVPAGIGKQLDILISNAGGLLTSIPGQALVHILGVCNLTLLAASIFDSTIDGPGTLNLTYDTASLVTSSLTSPPTLAVTTYTKRPLDEINPSAFTDVVPWEATDTLDTVNAAPLVFAQSFAIPDPSMIDFIVTVCGKLLGGTDIFCQDYRVRAVRDGGAAALSGAVITGSNPTGTGALATASATVVLSGNNLEVQVTGVAATNIHWSMVAQAQKAA